MNTTILELIPYGEYCYDLTSTAFFHQQKTFDNFAIRLKNNPELLEKFFKVIWSKATRFGMIGTIDNLFLPKEEVKICGYTNESIFTISQYLQPIIICKSTSPGAFKAVFDNALNSVFWKKPHFEDLFILNKDKLIFAVLTHENYGTIFGDRALFEELGIKDFQIIDKEENIKWKIEIQQKVKK